MQENNSCYKKAVDNAESFVRNASNRDYELGVIKDSLDSIVSEVKEIANQQVKQGQEVRDHARY